MYVCCHVCWVFSMRDSGVTDETIGDNIIEMQPMPIPNSNDPIAAQIDRHEKNAATQFDRQYIACSSYKN